VTDFIIEKLHHRPLALAKVGINISRSHSSDPNYWNMIEENLEAYLKAVTISDTLPVLYNTPYSLPLNASMMIMVKELRPEVLPLLGLMALFNGPCFSENLLKLFYRRISQSSLEYPVQMKYLEARSLIGMWENQNTDELMVCMDALRTHYIRETRKLDLRALAEHILSGSSGQEESMRNTEESIITVIIAAIELAEPFLSEVATKLEHLVRINNGGKIPQTLGDPSFLGITRTVRSHPEFRALYRFLNHRKEGGWKQEAYLCSKKVTGTDNPESRRNE
jgi:hypothetical protein